MKKTPLTKKRALQTKTALKKTSFRKKKKISVKNQAWQNVKKYLHKWFEDNGITKCEIRYEGCFYNSHLTYAHRLKRRHITTEDELKTVVVACVHCHDIVERDPKMYNVITEIIKNRGLR